MQEYPENCDTYELRNYDDSALNSYPISPSTTFLNAALIAV